VLVSDGKIVTVASNIRSPDGAQVVDGRGKTLLPGLIDSHVHIGGGDFKGITLRKSALFGVTTVISLSDVGETPRLMHEHARQEQAGELADFMTAGIAATVKGGHGTQFGVSFPTLDDPAQVESFVDARIAEGSDVIKVIYEDFGGRMVRLPKSTMKAVIEVAHARGKLAVVHAGQRVEHVRDAIESGADGVVHSFFNSAADDGYGKMFVSHNAFLIPTFPLQVSMCALPDNSALGRDPRIAPWLTSIETLRLNAAYRTPDRHEDCAGSFASIPILRDAGAIILAGTDASNKGTAYGASLHEELEILVRSGLSPAQSLSAATSAAARTWRFTDRGRIASGLRGDLLLVNGDPTSDIGSTRDIAMVWLAGVPVDRNRLLQKIKFLEQRTPMR